jgi:arylsulfatase A-like enzyme
LRALALAFAASIALTMVAGCESAPRSASAERPNVLLIVVDAMRADRLGAYGSTRGLSPFLDSLAARGVVFEHAYSATSWTNASVASLLTSRHAWQHGITSSEAILPASEVTLAETLGELGYATLGITANFLIGKANGFSQGFDSYLAPSPHHVAGVEVPVLERADGLNRAALDWWRAHQGQGRPGFIYLHYAETHTPYAPPIEAIERVFHGRPWPEIDKVNGLQWFLHLFPADAPDVRDVAGLYDTEVIAIDSGLARLFAELEREGFLRNAVVAITADHGEGLWDHGAFGHGGSLFEELIHVPLIMLTAGHERRLDVDDVVSLVDVAPTLVDFAGGAQPPSFAGHSFRALMRGPNWRNAFGLVPRAWQPWAAWPGVALSDMAIDPKSEKTYPPGKHLRAVVQGRSKLVTTIDGGQEYYDLARDPLEKAPGTVTQEESTALAQVLARLGPPGAQSVPVAQAIPLDEERKRQLRALGYAQ